MCKLNILTSRDIHIAVKKNDGIQYLMERFSFETEEILFQTIRKVAPSKAEDFIKGLKKKQKKANRLAINSEPDAEQVKEEIALTEEASQPSEEVSLTQEEMPAMDVKKEEIPVKVKLETLQKDELEISNMLGALEVQHKGLVATRRDIVSKLGDAREFLVRLQRIKDNYEKRVIELYSAYEQCKTKMEGLNEEIRGCSEYLKEVRENIACLKKVRVYLYGNGSIEVENADENPVSEELLGIEFTKLVCMPQAEELTIKQLKGVAKLRVMLLGYEAEDIEVVFDSESVQAFYESIVA